MAEIPYFSVIVPVFNRPQEVDELLGSLTLQADQDFEVLIVEDGSTQRCEKIVSSYGDRLKIKYFYKENSGQGFSRNYGFERALGEFLVVFDSDCLVPPHYFSEVKATLKKRKLDAYGGPDRAHSSFTDTQKAINYSMTSVFTTGGIRGSKKHVGQFHPRSFNMGISRGVFEKTKGYILPKKGEDIEFSIRIIRSGFKVGLIEEAYVYHKRRTDFKQFYQQLHFFGTARINLSQFFPDEVKLVHVFPAIFLLGTIISILLIPFQKELSILGFTIYSLFAGLIFVDSLTKNQSFSIAAKSVLAAFIQLIAYGHGFISEWIKVKFKRMA